MVTEDVKITSCILMTNNLKKRKAFTGHWMYSKNKNNRLQNSWSVSV